MTRIYKKTVYRPIPANAKIIRSGLKRYAVWQDANGNEIKREIVITRSGERTVEESPYFVVRYYDATGRLCERSTGCKERRSAEHKANQWLQDIEKVKAGILTQDECEVGKRQQFGVNKHLELFKEHLKAKGVTARYIRETNSRIVRVCTACKFHRLADMSAAVLLRWLNKQSAAGMGARTRNSYREVMITFCNWAVSDNSLPYNPFSKIPKVRESVDRRHERRALTPDEVERLLRAAEKRPLHDAEVFCRGTHKNNLIELTPEAIEKANRRGLERKLLYATFIYTGLRKGELASITASQVFLDAEIPHLVLLAKDEKSRNGSTLPLHPKLVKELRRWLKLNGRQSPSKKLFNVPSGLHRVLDHDLKFAGIAKRDSLNRVIDIHALRHTHATLLAQNGVSPGVAKSAMRHSDIRLTMNVYSHLELNDVANAVSRLPDFLNGNEQ